MEEFDKLVDIVKILRGPNGCPWDKAQTFDTVKSHIIEEAYELVEAIEKKDKEKLLEELGDFILQAVFVAQIANETGLLNIKEVLQNLTNKLIYMHPHVFENTKNLQTPEEVLKHWEEKKDKKRNDKIELPSTLPALMYAYKFYDKLKRKKMLQENERNIKENLKKLCDNPNLSPDDITELLVNIVKLAVLKDYKDIELRLKNKIDAIVEKANKEKGQ